MVTFADGSRPVFADGCREWPEQDANVELPIDRIIELYEQGFAGAFGMPEANERFRQTIRDNGYNPDGEATATAWGIAGSSDGGLHVPYVYASHGFRSAIWPGRPQRRGDCVSHGTKNAAQGTLGVELYLRDPDPVSRIIEGFPTIPREVLELGPIASEAIYWFRQHGGDGSSCALLANALCHLSGMWIRQNYPELGFDLSFYSAQNAGLWGSNSPPANVVAVGQQHLMRTATEPTGWEAAADLLANGYFLNSCGGQAWASTRDENGFSPTTSGRWPHSESYIAVDRRPWVAKTYNVPALFLMLNSWGPDWNRGGREIFDSAQFVPPQCREYWVALGLVNPVSGNLLIPNGSRWVDATTLSSRYLVAFSNAAGWPANDLVNLSFASG